LLVLIGLLAAAAVYQQVGHGRLSTFLLFGLVFGFILQRSRFCLVNAFREPFMSGAGEHARAAALALVLTTAGFTILKATDLKDAGEAVFPSFWFGSLAGGVLFGAGMVLAGGCGAGAIWRAGEGHLKLWFAVLIFALAASLTRSYLISAELITRLGVPLFLPAVIGWAGAFAAVLLSMVGWYLLSAWNERRRAADVMEFR
jgi:uncharacterized membrane protein YedE/YeeE